MPRYFFEIVETARRHNDLNGRLLPNGMWRPRKPGARPNFPASDCLFTGGGFAVAKSKQQLAEEAALAAIGGEWDKWSKDHGIASNNATGHDAFTFFGYVLQQRNHLLDFRAIGGDKWQVVHDYLLRTKRIFD
jgi:hypothetical protein